MIMDVLGVLIAFTSVILLLSIIVTSMVQVSQATFKLRPRNLVVGLSALLQLTSTPREPGSAAPPPTKEDRIKARKLLNTVEAGNLRPAKDPENWFNRLLGPTVSWIDLPTFKTAAGAITHPLPADDQVTQHFKVVEAAMEKRFLFRMRIVATLWAVVVAFVFQISAPQYLRDLWMNPEQRQKLEAMAEEILSDSQEAVATFESYENAADKALERLGELYPDSREHIEEASGVGTTKPYIVDELRLAVEDDPKRDQIIADYQRLLDEQRLQYADDLVTTATQSSVTLASMNIEPWSQKWKYYWDNGLRWRHLGGVLLTALLLTLGAPFWFNALKALVNLRDSMKEKLAPKEG